MHPDRSSIRVLLIPILWIALSPQPGVSQERTVVFNQVSVSGGEAGLLLEFEGGDELSISFDDGTVVVDGTEVGPYTPGGPLESAWRALLGEAVAMGPDAVAELLAGWTPPSGTTAESADAADQIASRLSEALTGPTATAPNPPDAPTPFDAPQVSATNDSLLPGLLGRSDRLRELAFALDDLDVEDIDIRLGETLEIDSGETLSSTVVMIDGTLEVDGTLDGDVVLMGATLELGPDGRVTGTVRSAGGSVLGNRSGIDGGVLELDAEVGDVPAAAADDDDLEDAIRDAVREATDHAPRFRSTRSGLRSFADGLGDLMQTLVSFGLLLAIGLGVLYFFPRHFEVVSRTASSATGRSLLVGIAGIVLALPVFVLGIVFLAVSIIGIPLLLAWIPLAPFVFAAATVFGFLAVSRNLGRWVSGHEAASFDGLDASKPAVQLGWGLALLLGAFALSNLFQMGGPWFGPFEGLLILIGVAAMMTVLCVGLGAVILSRMGRDRSHADPVHEPGAPGESNAL